MLILILVQTMQPSLPIGLRSVMNLPQEDLFLYYLPSATHWYHDANSNIKGYKKKKNYSWCEILECIIKFLIA